MELKDSFSMALKAIPQYFSSRAVQATLPPAFFFRVPPSPLPRTLPPPSDHPTLAHPFTVSYETYNQLLQPLLPVTVALLYVTVVTYLNAVNERRKFKPWAFSQTAFFKIMVIIHNITLALYSLWTCIGMVNALRSSFYSPLDDYGVAGTVDSLCKINGPRGYGSGATYNETTSAWGIANHLFHLGADGLEPDSTDVGRIWNEGLAFYGWLFYLSKYYEVIDTFIILAKGRKSSFLQTYHHAGAMICMWAGIRYMSPPIWMFVLVNSFIHSIMYTFYLCISLNIKVPVWFKRTLTTMQITQFVIGATYAFLHLFIKYKAPVSVPYLYRLGDAVSAAPSAASSVVSTAVATADGAALLKRLLLRAAGREGLAENVLNSRGEASGLDAVHAMRDFVAREERRFRQDVVWTHCIDTSGQAFAIWLNCLYLAPLTWLFARFFIKAYHKRDERRLSGSTSQKAYQSGKDAYKGVSRRLSEAFEDSQHGVIEGNGDEVAVVDGDEFGKEIKKAVSNATNEVKKVSSATKKGMNNALDGLKEKTDPLKAKAKDEFEDDLNKVKAAWEKTKTTLTSSKNNEASTNGQDTSETSVLQQTSDAISNTVNSVTQEIRKGANYMTESVSDSISQLTASSKRDQTQAGGERPESEQASGEKEERKQTSEQQETTSADSKTAGQGTPKLRKNESSHRSTDSQEFDDQQSSWIHVKDEAEEALGSAVDSVKSKAEQLKSTATTGKDADKDTETKAPSQSEPKEEADRATGTSANKSGNKSEKPEAASQPKSSSNKNNSKTEKGRQSKETSKPSSTHETEDKSQQEAKQGSSTSKTSTTQQVDGQSASREHEHLSYAEVAAQKPEQDDTNQSEPHHESSTTGSAKDDQSGKQSGKSNAKDEKSQGAGSSSSTQTKTTSTSSNKSTSQKSEKHETRTQSESTSQATDMISAVKAVAQTMEGDAKAEAEKFLSSMEATVDSGNEKGQSGSEPEASGDGSLWFEKLTSNIDSKANKAEKKEIDKIIDESEPVRDEVVDTAGDKKDNDEKPSGKDDKDKSTEDHREDGA